MKFTCLIALGILSSATAFAAPMFPLDDAASPSTFNRAALFNAPDPSMSVTGPTSRLFGSVGADVKLGINGIGFDVATPLSHRFNLRGTASFFGYETSFNSDGIATDATLHLGSAEVAVDFYPFAGRFHISPGLVIYDNNNASGTAMVPGGTTFSLGSANYTSSAADPVHGNAYLDIGAAAAPAITVGWGNILPRNSNHWSVPVEFGFAYIRQPAIRFNLMGTACDKSGCSDIGTDPTAQANLRQEQSDINADLNALRFFPIASVGLGYRF